jgi:glutaconate CoA-transferase subunit A
MSKVVSMRDAVAKHVHDGDTLCIDGFTHLICFAAAHEIIRQKRKNLTVCRLTPDVIVDQMIAAGCISKLIFSWAGNPGAGSLHAFRRAVESNPPRSRPRSIRTSAWWPGSVPVPRDFRSGLCVTTRVRTCQVSLR